MILVGQNLVANQVDPESPRHLHVCLRPDCGRRCRSAPTPPVYPGAGLFPSPSPPLTTPHLFPRVPPLPRYPRPPPLCGRRSHARLPPLPPAALLSTKLRCRAPSAEDVAPHLPPLPVAAAASGAILSEAALDLPLPPSCAQCCFWISEMNMEFKLLSAYTDHYLISYYRLWFCLPTESIRCRCSYHGQCYGSWNTRMNIKMAPSRKNPSIAVLLIIIMAAEFSMPAYALLCLTRLCGSYQGWCWFNSRNCADMCRQESSMNTNGGCFMFQCYCC